MAELSLSGLKFVLQRIRQKYGEGDFKLIHTINGDDVTEQGKSFHFVNSEEFTKYREWLIIINRPASMYGKSFGAGYLGSGNTSGTNSIATANCFHRIIVKKICDGFIGYCMSSTNSPGNQMSLFISYLPIAFNIKFEFLGSGENQTMQQWWQGATCKIYAK